MMIKQVGNCKTVDTTWKIDKFYRVLGMKVWDVGNGKYCGIITTQDGSFYIPQNGSKNLFKQFDMYKSLLQDDRLNLKVSLAFDKKHDCSYYKCCFIDLV